MNNDLISRSALKKEVEPYRYAICGFEGVLALIDNAPTVEVKPQCNQIAWEQGYESGYRQAQVDAIRRIAEQYSEHDELVPKWLSIGDMKGNKND